MASRSSSDSAEGSSIHERVAELERANDELQAIVQAQNKKIQAVVDVVIGEGRDLTESDIDAAPAVLEQVDELATLAETAMAVARAESDISEGTKKGEAKRRAKIELVKRCALAENGKSQLEAADVQDLAAPEYDVYDAEAARIIRELSEDWDCFEFREGTGKKNGPNNRVIGDSSKIPRPLARSVVNELADDSLTNSVSSQLLSGGVQ